jgi:hypothetical protein
VGRARDNLAHGDPFFLITNGIIPVVFPSPWFRAFGLKERQ